MTIVEISMFIAGVAAIITGKLPEFLFKARFGKGENETDPILARWYGLLLATPFPVVLMIDRFFGVRYDAAPESIALATLLEFLVVLVVVAICIIPIILARTGKNK